MSSRTILLCIRNAEFEINFFANNDVPDVITLRQAVLNECKNNTVLKNLLDVDPSNISFEAESATFPGRWTVLGDASPVNHGSILRCLQLCSNTPSSAGKDSGYGEHFAEITNASRSAPPTPSSSHVSLQGNGDIPETSRGTRYSSISSPLPGVASRIYDVPDVSMQTNSGSSVPEIAVGHTRQRHLPTSPARTQQQPDLNTPPIARTIPSSYRLPNCFGAAIDKKIEDETALTYSEISSVAREICNSLRPYSYSPLPSELMDISLRLVSAHKSLQVIKGDLVRSAKFLKYKLLRRMGRMRAAEGVTVKGNGGRPKRIKRLMSPRNLTDAPQIGDIVSYKRNVEELQRLYQLNTSGEEVKLLLQLTFPGRRTEILAEANLSVEDVNLKCPYLTQQLLMELDMVLGAGTCLKFRQKFLELVPRIIAVARNQKSKPIDAILNLPDYINMDGDFEMSSCAALQILPILLAANRRQSKTGRFFYDRRKDGERLASVIDEKPLRKTPYVVAIGNSLNLIADGKPTLMPSTHTDAVLCLMATYYIYNISYAESVEPTLLFLQGHCLGLKDDDFEKKPSIQVVTRQLLDDHLQISETSEDD